MKTHWCLSIPVLGASALTALCLVDMSCVKPPSVVETVRPRPPKEQRDYLHVKDTPLGSFWLTYREMLSEQSQSSGNDAQAGTQTIRAYETAPATPGERDAILAEATKALNGENVDYDTFRIALQLAGSRAALTDDDALVELASKYLTMRPGSATRSWDENAYLSAVRYLAKSPTKGVPIALKACKPQYWLNPGSEARGEPAELVAYRLAGSAVWMAVECSPVEDVTQTLKKLRTLYTGDITITETGVAAKLIQTQYRRYQAILSEGEENLKRRAAGQAVSWKRIETNVPGAT